MNSLEKWEAERDSMPTEFLDIREEAFVECYDALKLGSIETRILWEILRLDESLEKQALILVAALAPHQQEG